MKEYKLGRNSMNNLHGVDERLITLIERVIKKSHYDFGIPKSGGKRTEEEQKELYDKGVSKCDGKINKSYHQTGLAFDIFLYENGKASWSCISKYIETNTLFQNEFNLMKEEGIFKDVGCLIFGGDWKSFKDYPHHEYRE